MATFAIEIRERNIRRDGKYPVSIRLIHQGKNNTLSTDIYVSRKQIKDDFSGLKDDRLRRQLEEEILKYENMLRENLGIDLSGFSSKSIVDFIKLHKKTAGGATIDFIEFSNDFINELEKNGRKGYAESFKSVVQNLIDYFGCSVVYIKDINVKNLEGFIKYMLNPRTVYRFDKYGKKIELLKNGVSPQTLKDYMIDMQTLFKAARKKYNDEDSNIQLITHYPFSSDKLYIEVKSQPKKRELNINDLVKILTANKLKGQRMQLARDVLALSFYLAAMNTADLYDDDAKKEENRITYHRQKTRTRRKDAALTSIQIEQEALPLIKKYKDPDKRRLFCFYKMYSSFKDFNKNVNIGCKQLAKHLGIDVELSTYYMRHTWATIASEDCRINIEDIAFALTHVGASDNLESSNRLKVTRGYINKRFTRIDEINRQVLDFVQSNYPQN